MTLKQWENNGWLKAEPSSQKEIANLLAIVKRDLSDATGAISHDRQFGIAYNAALKLCTILVRAEGYRPVHGLQHYRTIMALPVVLGNSRKDDAKELVLFAAELKAEVEEWLTVHHSELFNR